MEKRFVGSFVNVILTRQTCGQRSSRTTESKRRAQGNYFSEWMCYMFLLSKCSGVWGLGLCTFWVFAKRNLLHNGDFPQKKLEFLANPVQIHWNRSMHVSLRSLRGDGRLLTRRIRQLGIVMEEVGCWRTYYIDAHGHGESKMEFYHCHGGGLLVDL